MPEAGTALLLREVLHVSKLRAKTPFIGSDKHWPFPFETETWATMCSNESSLVYGDTERFSLLTDRLTR